MTSIQSRIDALGRRRQARERLRQAVSRIRASTREINSANRRTIQKRSLRRSRLTQEDVVRRASAVVQASRQPQTAIDQVIHPNVEALLATTEALNTSNQDLHKNAQRLAATTEALVEQFQCLQSSGAGSQPSQAYAESFQATVTGLLQQSIAENLRLDAQSQEAEQSPDVNHQALQASSPATQHSQGHQSGNQTVQEETESQTASAQIEQSEDSVTRGEPPPGGGALPEGAEPGEGTDPGDSPKPGNDAGSGNDVESGDSTKSGGGTKSVEDTRSGDLTEPGNGTQSGPDSTTEASNNIAPKPGSTTGAGDNIQPEPESVTEAGDKLESGNNIEPDSATEAGDSIEPADHTEPGNNTQPSGGTELGRKLCANRTDEEFNHPYWYFDDAKPDNVPAKKWERMRLWRRARRTLRTRIYDEWMNNALRLDPAVHVEKLRGILNLKSPTLLSELPVVSLLAIKYFITSLLDIRMKRLMWTGKHREKDLEYARRTEFIRYVYSDQFLCFDYTIPEGETVEQRTARLARDSCVWLSHEPSKHKDCCKTSKESTDYMRATKNQEAFHSRVLLPFEDYPSE
ncbi:hypothetical protein QBC40DRAFT_333583 [Triangularia verruculosa]|uniref:Uncharacterized protein n=1 Tax=Triangularia verruculosa TaxID=2587418 RepID=A0AAN6XV10_9PEZI|nr:hypothetical protein QBC40DRAFT_333583 [Triangularia verruculosa]